MKKWLLGFLFSASVTSTTYAQGVQVGLKAGLNLARYTGNSASNEEDDYEMVMKRQAGLHGGLTVTIPMGKKELFAFQPELLYSQRGYRFKERGEHVKAREHYIDLPLVLQLNVKRFRFHAGPQVSYLLANMITYEYAGDKAEYKDRYAAELSLGYVAGIGYQLTSHVVLSARHNANFTGLDSTDSILQFAVGYKFGNNSTEKP